MSVDEKNDAATSDSHGQPTKQIFVGESFRDYKFARTKGAIRFIGRMFDQLEKFVATEHYGGSFDGKTALDAGCGFGINALDWVGRWAQSKVTGIDISPHAIEASNHIFGFTGVQNGSSAHFDKMDIVRLPQKKDEMDHVPFDAAWASCVLHFADDADKLSEMIGGIASVCRPGTVFFGTHAGNINFEGSGFQLENPVWWNDFPIAMQPPPDGRQYFLDGEKVNIITALDDGIPLVETWASLQGTSNADKLFHFTMTNFSEETFASKFDENGFDLTLFRVGDGPGSFEPLELNPGEEITKHTMYYFVAVFRGPAA